MFAANCREGKIGRVTINSELFEQRRLESTSSSSTTAPSVERITVNLPSGIKVYGALDEENFERRDHLIFAGTEPNHTKILFLDFHQGAPKITS